MTAAFTRTRIPFASWLSMDTSAMSHWKSATTDSSVTVWFWLLAASISGINISRGKIKVTFLAICENIFYYVFALENHLEMFCNCCNCTVIADEAVLNLVV